MGGIRHVLVMSACAMPTYHRDIYEIESNCDGDVKLVLTHDPDPRELRVSYPS